ncbi:MAG: MSMEG_0565 family glycosyltransferase [Elainellaceae cyanobacterium]
MPTPLRIALFTYSTKPRGSVIHTLELADALHALGHQVCVYALDKDGSGFGRSLTCDYELISAQPAPKEIDALIQQRIQEFVVYLQRHDRPYDIYHAQDCLSANALAILREQRQITNIVRTVHHIEAFASPYLQACQKRSIDEPDLCLCVSDYWQAQLQEQYQIWAPRVVNGVNVRRFSALPNGSETKLKKRLGLTGNPVYLTVGGIEPRKNSIGLLQAFAQVLVDFPQAQLVIAGGATLFDYQPYRDAFFAKAEQLGIAIGQALVLPGVIADANMPVLYRTADAFVFPSLTEGWGLVVLEAIASGLPVVTANQPPFTEFLTDNQALLIDPGSSEAIADAMRTIVQPQSRSLVQQSQTILTTYSWNTSAQMHIDHYRRLLTHPNSYPSPIPQSYARNPLPNSMA